jgi:hypothetical protein
MSDGFATKFGGLVSPFLKSDDLLVVSIYSLPSLTQICSSNIIPLILIIVIVPDSYLLLTMAAAMLLSCQS